MLNSKATSYPFVTLTWLCSVNLITAHQVTDRCGGLRYLSSKPGAADAFRVLTLSGHRALLVGAGNSQQPPGWAAVCLMEAVDFLIHPEVPFFAVVTKEW